MSAEPLRSEVNRIHFPSRENEALKSRAVCGRKGLGLRPSPSAMKMSAFNGANPEYAIVYFGCAPAGARTPPKHSANPRNRECTSSCYQRRLSQVHAKNSIAGRPCCFVILRQVARKSLEESYETHSTDRSRHCG